MLNKIIGKFTGSNDSKLSNIQSILKEVNAFEESVSNLKDDDIAKKTLAWRNELRNDALSQQAIQARLNEILPEAYALAREAAKRAMGQRPRDVQVLAAIVLHQGKIAEQKTGEGKTLTATLALYLNSLAGKGTHLVTPNDYLSKHGVGWYGPVYNLLGVSAGVIVHDKAYKYDPEYVDSDVLDEYSRHLRPITRAEAYECDITYGTNSEFGFDYLRDNMATERARIVQKNPKAEIGVHNYAIVDEVDNILIDIARTPLIISTQKDLQPQMYNQFAELAEGLVNETDYDLDEKDKVVTLTEIGIRKVERKLGVENLYEKDFETIHHIENALKAKAIYLKDRDYVVKDGEIIIVDQNTGRLLIGNRWSNGLHQAIEAKEKVQIQPESRTLATISYQNYYRLYDKLAGMTGTALTEADEFFKIYSLDVVSIPTHKPVMRIDHSDVVYKTEAAKYRAMAKDIAEKHRTGQPVLVGTVSVDKSQLLSGFLKHLKIPHEILNAKNHDREALIIAQAGSKNSVTVSTNMAGRGVDIILGGDPYDQSKYEEIVSLGGLYVIGTERHDSRRIDNQLRGRAGRQGDAGESRFYLSLQDSLIRIFGGEKIESIMNRIGLDENQPIEAGIISRSIENAQKKVEGINFDQRRGVVEYDDVMNVQRETIYSIRRNILFAQLEETKTFLEWIFEKLSTHVSDDFKLTWDDKMQKYGEKVWFEVVKQVSLEVIDVLWMDHIDTMDDLRSGVRLRGYGQVDPLVEYKREGKILFEKLLTEAWHSIGDRLEKVEVQIVQQNEQAPKQTNPQSDAGDLEYLQGKFESGVQDESGTTGQSDNTNRETKPPESRKRDLLDEALNYSTQDAITPAKSKKPGRNEPCWCGSGKKYKKCHYPN